MVHQTDSYSADICDSQWHSTMAVSCCAMYRSKWNLTPLAHFVFHLLWDNYIKWLGCINMTLIWYCVQWDDEQLCPFWSHALVLWLWSCSDTSCIQICHTWHQNASWMASEWQVVITFLFFFARWGNCNRCTSEKNGCMHLAVQLAVGVWYLASGTNFTTLSQLFGIDKWTVSKCVWNCMQSKKKLSRQSFLCGLGHFYLDFVPTCVSCFKSCSLQFSVMRRSKHQTRTII